jgi:hypothetical protein
MNIIKNDHEITVLSIFLEREEEIYLIVENLRLLDLTEVNEDCRTYVIDMCKYYDRLLFHKTTIDKILLNSDYDDELLFELFEYLICLPTISLDTLNLFVKRNSEKITNTYFIRLHDELDILEKIRIDFPYYEIYKDIKIIREKIIYLTFIWSSMNS